MSSLLQLILHFFPTPYLEEMFYSIGARFSKSMGLGTGKKAVQLLLGTKLSSAPIDLPSNLSYLEAAFPLNYPITAETIIQNHTALPYFAPFISSERIDTLMAHMLTDDGKSVHNLLGLNASRISTPPNLRYCPQCLQQQRKQFGRGYWVRWMQVSSTFYCPIHQTALIESDVRINNRKSPFSFITLESVVNDSYQNQANTPIQINSHLVNLTLDTIWLFQNGWKFRGNEENKQRYLKLLYEAGYGTYGGKLYIQELNKAFEAFFTPKLLDKLNCSLSDSKGSWLAILIYRPHIFFHPLQHLLLIHFLGFRASNFFTYDATRKPFGEPNWPCLNKVCVRFQEPVIEVCDISINRDFGNPVGTFSCPYCHFIYLRHGPDLLKTDRMKRGRIVQYGPIWESKLQELWGDLEVSLNRMGKELGVDPQSVKAQAQRLNLLFPRPGHYYGGNIEAPPVSTPIKENKLVKRNEMRKAWNALRKKHPYASMTELCQIQYPVYKWLACHDIEWLNNNKPARKPLNRPDKFIDWELEDFDIAVRVLSASLTLTQGKQIRFTKTKLRREIRAQSVLMRKQELLPVSSGIIERLIETRLEFTVRRMWDVAWRLFTEKKPVTRSQLIMQTSCGSFVKEPIIEKTINQTLNWMDSTKKQGYLFPRLEKVSQLKSLIISHQDLKQSR